jgi:hypothetical protein
MFAILFWSALMSTVHASIFGVTLARVNYDIVNLQTRPTGLDTALVAMQGTDISTGTIAGTASIPKGGMLVNNNIFVTYTKHKSSGAALSST